MIKDRKAITVPELVENEDRRAAFAYLLLWESAMSAVTRGPQSPHSGSGNKSLEKLAQHNY